MLVTLSDCYTFHRFMMNRYHPLLPIILLLILASCRPNPADITLARIDSIIEEKPDSALQLIDNLDTAQLVRSESKARYALLKSMALDKNYIDLKHFDVLQPAIDYYITAHRGAASDRMRTYYYQGRIFENQGELGLAMKSYIHGTEQSRYGMDSLVLARLYVAIGFLDFSLYRFEEAIPNYQEAANLYHKFKPHLELDCQKRILCCYILNQDKEGAQAQLQQIVQNEATLGASILDLLPLQLYYSIRFGDEEEILKAIHACIEAKTFDEETILNMATGFIKVGDSDRALCCLNSLPQTSEIRGSKQFLAIQTRALEAHGDYQKALETYKAFNGIMDSIHVKMFQKDLASSEERYTLEMENHNLSTSYHRLLKIVWIVGGISLFFIVGLLLLYNKVKRNKDVLEDKNVEIQKDLETLKQKSETLVTDNEKLVKEFKALRESQLTIRDIMDNQESVSPEFVEMMRSRGDQINSLFVNLLRGKESAEQKYLDWVVSTLKDCKVWPDYVRLSFSITHRPFILYLQSRGLTNEEINFVCLQALGVKGGEIGKYFKTSNQYNISSDIRSKLGLDTNSTYIGPYIRNLMNSMDIS